MRRRDDLVFWKHLSFAAPGPGWELSAAAVDDEADYLCLWSAGGRHLVTGSTLKGEMAIRFSAAVRYPKIAGLPGGGWVVADTRVNVDSMTGYRQPISSWVFDAGGRLTAEGNLGDGIQHLLSTRAGHLWLGYFDEGIYGGGETEHHGLVRFNSALEPSWLFPYGAEHGVIDDCYALNVRGETATVYFYGAFDIAQVRRDAVTNWSGAPAGAHGLLVNGDRCALIGGYAERRDVVSHLRLGTGEVELVGEGRIDGLPSEGPQLERICRGPEMHVIVGTDWYRASIT